MGASEQQQQQQQKKKKCDVIPLPLLLQLL